MSMKALGTALILLAVVSSPGGTNQPTDPIGSATPANASASSSTGGSFQDEVTSVSYSTGIEVRVASNDQVDHYIGLGVMKANARAVRSLGTKASSLGSSLLRVETGLFVMPITYTQRTHPSSKGGAYLGGGGGVYISRASVDIAYPGGSPQATTTDFVPSLHILAGLSLKNTATAEVRYTWMFRDCRLADIDALRWRRDLSGFSLTLSARF